MSLGVLTTGVRPGVLLNLPVGPYFAGKPAFNIFFIEDGEDCEVFEESGSSSILRRVNPYLPPSSKACPHQIKFNTAKCPVSCDKELKPDGISFRLEPLSCRSRSRSTVIRAPSLIDERVNMQRWSTKYSPSWGKE